jgi:hypothetical protein
MHGDLTPWNLRRTSEGVLFLLDWEEAGWGPPRADEVLYRATAAVLGLCGPPKLSADEAVGFWEERVLLRPARNERDRTLNDRLLATLQQASGSGGS